MMKSGWSMLGVEMARFWVLFVLLYHSEITIIILVLLKRKKNALASLVSGCFIY